MRVRYRFGSATGFVDVPLQNPDFQTLYMDIKTHAKTYGISITNVIEELIGMRDIEQMERYNQTRLKDFLIEEV